MELKDYLKYLDDHKFTAKVQHIQFGSWLNRLMVLNTELHEKYNYFYQNMFYIIFHELITEGLEYLENKYIQAGDAVRGNYNSLFTLYNFLRTIPSKLPEAELDYIEYRRHESCHIFQNQYEMQILKNGTLRDQRKGKKIEELNEEFNMLLDKYETDKGIDLHIHALLYPLISKLQQDLSLSEAEQ